jgi:RNA polymerase sigma-70 factor (ECF subfamily)
VDEHAPILYRLAYRLVGDRHEAEDIVQDTFRSAWKTRDSYVPAEGERAWLTAILRRRVVDRWRKKPQPRPAANDSPFEIGVPGVDPTADEYSDEMQQALGQLAPELREALLLVVVGELTHQEAANLLKTPLGTILSRVSRARTRLRELLLDRARN